MKTTYKFLKALKQNNNRAWFIQNKTLYEASLEEMKIFMHDLKELMNLHDEIEGEGKLFRIYRDVRFSHDKTPYKTGWSGSFRRATAKLRGGYYIHIAPGNTFVTGGFFNPNTQDLNHIRQQIAADPDPLRKILKSKQFTGYFKEIIGEKVKTSPKGFTKEHPDLDLISFKQFLITHKFNEQEVISEDFPATVNQGFKNMRPFFNYMSEILTTDLNGVSLI